MNYDKAYLINLEQSPKRRDYFCKSAKKAGIDVEWIPAIYGLDVDIEDYRSRGYIADDFKLRMAGSLGTLLSHIHVWERIAADPECEVGLVFEDDAVFVKNFKTKLEAIPMEEVPDDWDMLWLGWHRLDCEPVTQYFGRPRKSKKHSVNSGHFAYMVKSTSVEKLKALLLPYNNRSSKDVILRKKFDQFNAYFLMKKIVKTPVLGFDSVRKNINNPQRLKKMSGKWVIQKIRQKLLG